MKLSCGQSDNLHLKKMHLSMSITAISLFFLLFINPLYSQVKTDLSQKAFDFLLAKNYPAAEIYADSVLKLSEKDVDYDDSYFIARLVKNQIILTKGDKKLALSGYNTLLNDYLSAGNEKNKFYSFIFDLKIDLMTELKLYKDAIAGLKENLSLAVQIFSDSSVQYLKIRIDLIKLHLLDTQFNEANELCQVVIKVIQKYNHGKLLKSDFEVEEFIAEYYLCSSEQYHRSEFVLAETSFKNLVLLVDQIFGENHDYYLRAIDGLVLVYISTDQLQKALNLNNKALSLSFQLHGKRNFSYASSLNKMGIIYQSLGYFIPSITYFKESLTILKDIKYSQESPYAQVLTNLGISYLSLGKIDSAQSCFDESKVVLEFKNKTNSTQYAGIMDNLGTCFEKSEKYPTAKVYYEIALELYEKLEGNVSLDKAKVLNNLGLVNKRLLQFDEAKENYSEAAKIYDKIFDKTNSNYLMVLNNLATLALDVQNYTEAKQILENIEKLYETIVGNKHPDYARVVNNLGVLYLSLGNHGQAQMHLLKALSIYKESFGNNNTDVANCLFNLAILHKNKGEFLHSFDFSKEVNSILAQLGKENESLYLDNLMLIIDLMRLTNNHANAGDYQIELENILNGNEELTELQYSTALNSLGVFYSSLGDLDLAKKYINQAISVRNENFSEKSIGTYDLYENLALVYYAEQNYDKALEILDKNTSIGKFLVDEMSKYMSINEKLMLSKQDNSLPLFLSILEDTPDSVISNHIPVLEYLIEKKGMLLRETNYMKDIGYFSDDSIAIAKYDKLVQAKKLLNLLYQKTIDQVMELGYSIDSLEELSNLIEKEISLISKSNNSLFVQKTFSYEDCKKSLNDDEAAIQYFRFNKYANGWTDSVVYAAILIKKNSKYPEIFFLNRGKLLEDHVIKNYRSGITSLSNISEIDSVYAYEVLTEAYNMLWEPLKNRLEGINSVFLSLDGELHRINFGLLMNPANHRYLFEDVKLYNVNSLMVIKKPLIKSQSREAVLIGYPNFSPDSTSTSLVLSSSENTYRDFSLEAFSDSTFSDSVMTRYFLSPLEGTKKEIQESGKYYSAKDFKVRTLLYDDASEFNLKSVKGPQVLHIATHGFFKSSPSGNYIESHFYGSETKRSVANPMLRSGLFLSGSETYMNLPPEKKNQYKENGIFTANEAANLDLAGTDIVVLSACETGLGEIRNGEGVYGLQRGFLIAGANALLMSLWKVDDDATYLMVTEFTKKYADGIEKHVALKEAQQIVRQKYPHPFYWGAFVLVGR